MSFLPRRLALRLKGQTVRVAKVEGERALLLLGFVRAAQSSSQTFESCTEVEEVLWVVLLQAGRSNMLEWRHLCEKGRCYCVILGNVQVRSCPKPQNSTGMGPVPSLLLSWRKLVQ